MIKVNSTQRKALEDRGMLRHKKVKKGIVVQEPNFYIASKTHKSRAKTCYVVEEPRIVRFLENLENKKPNRNSYNKYNKKRNNQNYFRPNVAE